MRPDQIAQHALALEFTAPFATSHFLTDGIADIYYTSEIGSDMTTRREFLATGALGTTAFLAGCLGDDLSDEEQTYLDHYTEMYEIHQTGMDHMEAGFTAYDNEEYETADAEFQAAYAELEQANQIETEFFEDGRQDFDIPEIEAAVDSRSAAINGLYEAAGRASNAMTPEGPPSFFEEDTLGFIRHHKQNGEYDMVHPDVIKEQLLELEE